MPVASGPIEVRGDSATQLGWTIRRISPRHERSQPSPEPTSLLGRRAQRLVDRPSGCLRGHARHCPTSPLKGRRRRPRRRLWRSTVRTNASPRRPAPPVRTTRMTELRCRGLPGGRVQPRRL